MPELSDAERRRLSQNLRRISKIIEGELLRASGRKDIGFSLVVWGAFGDDSMIQYVSNVEREDVMRHLIELVQAWVDGMPDLPFHERQ